MRCEHSPRLSKRGARERLCSRRDRHSKRLGDPRRVARSVGMAQRVEVQAVQSMNDSILSERIRATLAGSGTRFSLAQQRRLRELADAAESAAQVTGAGIVAAMTVVLRGEILQ